MTILGLQVGELYDLVTSNTHSSFPVCRKADTRLQGTIPRKRLAVLFARRAFGKSLSETGSIDFNERSSDSPDQEEMFSSNIVKIFSPLVPWADLEKPYPRYPPLDHTTVLLDEDRLKVRGPCIPIYFWSFGGCVCGGGGGCSRFFEKTLPEIVTN